MTPAPAVKIAEVEWRVDSKPRDGQARFVPYVNAPIVARLLDEWVGPGNWSDTYEQVQLDGKVALWCHLSVRHDDGSWVTKTDVGVPSNMEGQKGMVSDAFKRAACLKWGVARNVYELPTMWAPCREDHKGNAWPNDQTLPTILRKLKAQGLADAEGGRVQEVEPAAEPEPTVHVASPEQHQAIRDTLSQLPDAQAAEIKDWWKANSLPPIARADRLTEAQVAMVLARFDQLSTTDDPGRPFDDAEGALL